MLKCPIDSCGRQFQNELTMIEHVKRRHPLQSEKVRQQATNQMLEKQTKITEEMNKLPKMQKVLQMSKQKRPLEFQRRSSSKQKKQIKSMTENSQIKVSEIIAQSRQLLQDNTGSKKLLKRPSLSKKPSQQIDAGKLPSLTQSKVKRLKLQAIKTQLSSTLIKQSSQKLLQKHESQTVIQSQQQQMYSTAPNFTQQMGKKIELLRSRVKKQGQLSNRSSSKDLKKSQATISSAITNSIIKKRLSSHTAENIAQQVPKQQVVKPAQQRPIKRLLERSSKKQVSQQSILTNTTQQLSQSVYIQSKISSAQQLGNEITKGFTFQQKSKLTLNEGKKFIKKQKPIETSPISSSQHQKLNQQLESQFNWQQRTVTIRNKNLQNVTIPYESQVEYLCITNCGLKSIDLNECFSLITLSLNNNQLENFQFLQQTINGGYENIEEIFMDHNKIQSLGSLPTYLQLKKLSLTFNNIKGIDELTKILAKFTLLQELDLSFNPVRKQPNYKLSVLAVCNGLKKLDGMVVTKFDRQLAQQYHKMYYDYLNILPLSNTPIEDSKFRPSTAVSINYQQQLQLAQPSVEMTEQELTKQIEILEKMIKQTKQQYEIIQQENNALQDQISTYQTTLGKQKDEEQFNPKLYAKLSKQVEELEMLNFMQYASEKQLEQILMRKCKQKGISIQMLAAV